MENKLVRQKTNYLRRSPRNKRIIELGIYFIKAEVVSYFPANAGSVWEHLAGNFELYTVPGDHSGLVEKQYTAVAKLLSQMLTRLPNLSNVARIDR